jgi:hypothetical protein
MTKLTIAFRNFANAPNKVQKEIISTAADSTSIKQGELLLFDVSPIQSVFYIKLKSNFNKYVKNYSSYQHWQSLYTARHFYRVPEHRSYQATCRRLQAQHAVKLPRSWTRKTGHAVAGITICNFRLQHFSAWCSFNGMD